MASRAELADTLAVLEAAAERKKFRKIDFYRPYPKQLDFHRLGEGKSERLLMAGNRLGKTEAGAAEVAFHLTGQYPDWWPGRRWTRPVRVWAAGVTAEAVRGAQQEKLFGTPGVVSAMGTGYVPKAAIKGTSLARGVTYALDTAHVAHISGGTSTMTFKSYKEGRENFQAEEVDIVWFDEEPPDDIYTEGRTRTLAVSGMVFLTFTPLKGRTQVVERFLSEPADWRAYVQMGLKDALHIAPERRAEILAGYPAHEREARAEGTPMLGEGKVFSMPLEALLEPRIPSVPIEWRKIWGVDFGIDHPFAAVLLAWDVDTDTIHLLHGVRMAGGTPLNHVPAVRAIAAGVPVAWPHDGHKRDAGSGIALAAHYRNPGPGMAGLQMLGSHATHPEGGFSFMAGIDEMNLRMETGRFKVSEEMHDWHEEYRLYHYDKGQVIKLRDDLLSASRVALMMKRFAKPMALGARVARRPHQTVARDIDFDY